MIRCTICSQRIENGPLISIIVPVYNVGPYLEKCIGSIMEQTYKNVEIILVDDGSSDGCGRICDRYAQVDNRIKVIHKKNGGLSDARNAGIEIASGRYVGFIDSDDHIEPTMYERLLTVSLAIEADIVCCSVITEDEDHPLPAKESDIVYIFSPEEALDDLLKKNQYLRHAAWNKLYKKECFASIRFPVRRLFEDAAVMYKIFENAAKIAHLETGSYHYVQRHGSISNGIYRPEMVSHRIDNGLEAFYHFDGDLVHQKMAYIWNERNIYALWETAYSNMDYETARYAYRAYKKISSPQMMRCLNGKQKLKSILFLFCPRLFWTIRKMRRPRVDKSGI